ncbi:hypothetical protein AMJ40_07565 [candidate division TA06 bacterium DG_26]|uniref:Uncharacterized protein n=1 Tax=candidate division TA06 bacterium DG_26 TaxID=1703771 RepID=A0A0S7WE47_UNCT6|nr:MAG: hypothetical protein AMJ40_07565 [candidate division TA06 bacterium DG_26]
MHSAIGGGGEMQREENLYVSNPKEWRAWLWKNHTRAKEVWLVFYKKQTDTPSIPYDDAVEEALCGESIRQ